MGISFISAFFMGVLVLAAAIVVVVLLMRKGIVDPGLFPANPHGDAERAETFSRKREQFKDEQRRILSMVADGKISPEEGERLIGALERETATMACPYCGEDIRIEAVMCRHCGSNLYGVFSGAKRLTRSNNKMLAGVCGGIAEHLNWDPTLVRLLVILIILFSSVLPGVIVYIVAALIMPGPDSAAAE